MIPGGRFLAVVLCLSAAASVVSAHAQSAEPARPQLSMADGEAGILQYLPGTWGMVSVAGYNPTNKPAELLVVTYFDGHPHLQFGRRFWLPPQSQRKAWYPVLPPAHVPEDQKRFDVTTLVMQPDQTQDAVIKSGGGDMLRTGLLPLTREGPVTAMIAPEEQVDSTHQAVAAMRQSRELRIAVPNFRDPLPPMVQMLDGLDQLVISGDTLCDDTAALLAVRRWLHDGGRLWIMLNQVQPSTVARLLGTEFRVSIVDHVDLTHVEIVTTRETAIPRPPTARDFDEPVEMVRVLGPEIEPVHTVNGWPASFWQPAGRGHVLFTTLEARAWTRDRRPDDPKPKHGGPPFYKVALEELQMLGAELLEPRRAPAIDPADFDRFVSSQIGYRIIGRETVLLVLGLFCLLLVFIGLGLAAVGRLPLLGWIGPGLAIVAAVALTVLGQQNRSSVEPTLAIGQFIETAEGVDDLRLRGLLATYHQHETDAPMGADEAALFVPDRRGREGSIARMIWTDMNRWAWHHVSLPSGVREASLSYAAELSKPIAAQLGFGPEGATGRLEPGPMQGAADAIVLAPAAPGLGLQLAEDGTIRGGIDDVLSEGQYVAGTMLDDRQQRRQAMLRAALNDDDPPYPDRPTVLFWAEPLDIGLVFDPALRRVGSSLVAVPLVIEPPTPGTVMAIPSTFIPYRSVPLPGQPGGSTLYDNARHRWIGPVTDPSQTHLRFRLPRELMPLRISNAELSVAINAPSRKMEIVAVREGEIVPLFEQQSPVGTLRFRIDDPELLQLDEQQGLVLGIHVGKAADEDSISITQVGWKIDDVRLNVRAEKLAPE